MKCVSHKKIQNMCSHLYVEAKELNSRKHKIEKWLSELMNSAGDGGLERGWLTGKRNATR